MEPGHEAIYDEITELRKTGRDLRGLLRRRIDEQDAIIVGQRAAIETLRVVFEECAQGATHLAGRLDKEETARKVAEETLLRLLSDGDEGLLARSNNHLSRTNRLEAQAKRVREQFPQVANRLTAEQCVASGPREEGDDDRG